MGERNPVHKFACTAFSWSERTRRDARGNIGRELTAIWKMSDEKLLGKLLLLIQVCSEELQLVVQYARDEPNHEMAESLLSGGLLPVLDRCLVWPRLVLEFLWRSNTWSAVGDVLSWWPVPSEPADFRRRAKLILLRAVKLRYISASERAALEAKLINWESQGTHGIHRETHQEEELRQGEGNRDNQLR